MTEPEAVSTTAAPAPGGAFSQAIAFDRFVWTAGQVGVAPETGVLPEGLEEQVEQAIENLEAVLSAADCGIRDVVKTTCFLVDIADFPVFDAIYRRRFGDPLPGRSTVGVQLAGNLRFEIEACAVRPEGSMRG